MTPRVNWRNAKGAPQGNGGTDYQHFPDHAYFMDLDNISRAGTAHYLEVPMSIQYKHPAWLNTIKQGLRQASR